MQSRFSDNSKEAEYVNALARYEHALEEERITFTIKEAKPQTPDKIDKTMDNWVAKETLNKYHTLPPIRALAPSPLDRPQDRYNTIHSSLSSIHCHSSICKVVFYIGLYLHCT